MTLLTAFLFAVPAWAGASLPADLGELSDLWGKSFQDVSATVRGLVRTTDGMDAFQQSRVAKFKVHGRLGDEDLTRFYLFKSNRLYQAEWRFRTGSETLVKSLIQNLDALSTQGTQTRDIALPKGIPFQKRGGTDHLWQTEREEISLRVIRSHLTGYKTPTLRIYLTFRAKDSVMPPKPRQLQPDEAMRKAGDEAQLLFLGGIPVDIQSLETLGEKPSVVATRVWTPLGSLLKQADLTIAFLETPMTRTLNQGLSARPRKADPTWISLLTEAGVDLVGLSAPTIMDYRAAGLLETMETLKQAGVFSVGAGKDLAEARRPSAFVSHGVTIGFVGFYAEDRNDVEDLALEAGVDRAGVAGFHKDLDALTRMVQTDVSNLASQVDVVVALFHWGEGEGLCASPYQRELADTALRSGAKLVVGQTPALYQNVSERQGGVAFFGLADLFGDTIPPVGHLLQVSVNKHGVTGYRFVPLNPPDAQGRRTVPRPLEGTEKEQAEAHTRRVFMQCR